MGLHVLVRHWEQTDQGIRGTVDYSHALHPVCDSGFGLRWVLDGMNGEKVVVGTFDPGVNLAGALAARHREDGIEPGDAGLDPAAAAWMFHSAMKRREEIRARADAIPWE